MSTLSQYKQPTSRSCSKLTDLCLMLGLTRDFSNYLFGSRRNGKGKHTGVDVICSDGATVYAPFSGELSGPIKFFHNGNAIDDGVQIRGSGK